MIAQGCIHLLGLQEQNITSWWTELFSHSSGGGSLRSRSAGLCSLEASLLALQMATLSYCLHVVFSLCTHIPAICPSPYKKDISHIGLGPHPYDII